MPAPKPWGALLQNKTGIVTDLVKKVRFGLAPAKGGAPHPDRNERRGGKIIVKKRWDLTHLLSFINTFPSEWQECQLTEWPNPAMIEIKRREQ